jgi:hypothetical protein
MLSMCVMAKVAMQKAEVVRLLTKQDYDGSIRKPSQVYIKAAEK